MTHILEFAVLGLGPGALIAGLALSVVLTYRGSGAINLAAGGIAVIGAYVFYGLKTSGELFLPPLPFCPHEIQLGGSWAVGPSVAVALAVCVFTGALLDLLVWRPLRASAPLAKLLASLGVLLAIQSVVMLRFGSNGQLAPPVFASLQTHLVNIFGATVPLDQFALFGVVVLAGILLTLTYKYTRFGLATRAAQENEVNAVFMGLSPSRLSMANSVLAALAAGGLGILAASQTQLDPVTIPFTIIPALGAALLARFTSFSLAVLVGVLLGVAESLVGYLQSLSWFPTDVGHQPLPGVVDLLFFVVIVVAMLWRGSSLPQRGAIAEARLPPAPEPKRLAPKAALFTLLLVVAFLVFPYEYRQALTTSLIGILLCLSLVVITGFVGQVSLLQVALAGVAGFIVSKFATGLGIGFPLGGIAGVVGAVIVGVVAGLPALRVRGVTLAIVTLAGAQALSSFWFTDVRWGGGLSSLMVPEPHLFGIDLGSNASFPINASAVPSPVLGFVCAAAVIPLTLLVASLRRSELGKRMLAIRSNERAAASAGINVRHVKVIAFAISSMLAGVAGVLYAYSYQTVSANQFQLLLALTFIAFAYMGGISTVAGAVLAGLGVTDGLFSLLLNNVVGIPDNYQLLFAGLLLVVTIVKFPGGLATVPPPWRVIRQHMDKRRGLAVVVAGAGVTDGLLATGSSRDRDVEEAAR